MNLQDQVITPQQAQKLLQLGVMKSYKDIKGETQPASLFVYVSNDGKEWECVYTNGYNWSMHPNYSAYLYIIPAFTKAEIDDMIRINRVLKFPNLVKGNNITETKCNYLIGLIERHIGALERFIVDRINDRIKAWFVKQK